MGVVLGVSLIAVSASGTAAADPSTARQEFAALPRDHKVGPAGLPGVLSGADVVRYRQIFALQEEGAWSAADALIAALDDRRLLGHVLAQRYLHPTAWRSSFEELAAWLASYADHPDARRIHRLALRRKPAGAEPPVVPAPNKAAVGFTGEPAVTPYRSAKVRTQSEEKRARIITRQIRDNLRRTRLTVTERLLDSAAMRHLFDRVEIDRFRARLAAAWLYAGRPETAYRVAEAAIRRSRPYVPEADWIAGISAWRLDDLGAAVGHFEQVALSDRVSAWTAAGGAYWAARAHLRLRNPAQMSRWLAIAAEHPRTFYGLVARRALGMRTTFDFHQHGLTPHRLDKLMAKAEGQRALALLQVGEFDGAEAELLRLGGWDEPEIAKALLALAERAKLPALSYRLAERHAKIEGGTRAIEAGLYPIPPWRPTSGFAIDRALVYALIRQESEFQPEAESPFGASGLMQLMPRTAEFVAETAGDGLGIERLEEDQLFDPAINLELGQRYIAHLLEHDRVQGDLFRLVAAYNGGPGNLAKWEADLGGESDPLMFIECLPSRETRLFIERVLTNFWIYRERLGQDTPSLDAIAAGEWPSYEALDRRTREFAQHGTN